MQQKKCELILGIDLEGVNLALIENGIQLDVDRVTEIGAVMWDCGRQQPVQFLSELINEPDHLPISEELTELTGIDDEMLNKWAHTKQTIPLVLSRLKEMMETADYCMAHNAHQYDLPMLGAMFERYGMKMPEKVWIDTLDDIEYPKKITHKNMAGLEHAHGFINPFPHRAVTDVLSMLKIASHYDFDRMAKLAASPKIMLVATLDAPNWRNRDEVDDFNRVKNKVSKARFRWDAGQKRWTKKVHKVLFDENKLNLDFDFTIENELF